MAVELATAYISLVPSAKGITSKLEKELGGLDKVGDKAGGDAGDGFAGGFLGVAKTAMLAGVAAIGVAVSKGLADSINIEAAGAKLNAQLGATGAFAEDLGAIAGDLYAGAYGESLEQVNEAIKNVWQNGLVSEDASNAEIESVTATVLDLATAFDVDLASATNAVSQLLRTGLVDDATEAFDIITRGFQQGADKGGDFLDTLNEYATQFRKLGIEADVATGLMTQGLQAGARDSDIVADAFKEFSIRAIDGSELTTEAFENLGVSAEEMSDAIAKGGPEAADALDKTLDKLREVEDPADRAAIAVGLFGTQAEDLGDALYALDPSEAVKALGDVGGAADEMSTTLNDTSAVRIESFKREVLQGLADFVGGTLLPGLQAFGGWVKDMLPDSLDSAGEAFDTFKRLTQPVVDLVADLGDAFKDDGLSGALGTLGEKVVAGWPVFKLKLGELLGKLGAWVTDTARPWLLAKLEEWGKAFIEWIAPATIKALEWLGVTVIKIVAWVKEVGLPALQAALKDWTQAFIDWVKDVWPGLELELQLMLLKLGEWIAVDAGPQIGLKLNEWSRQFAKWVGPATLNMLLRLMELEGALLLWIVEMVPKLAAKLTEWSKSFASWIVDEATPWMLERGADFQAALIKWMEQDVLPAIGLQTSEWTQALVTWADKAKDDLKPELETLASAMALPFTTLGEVIKDTWNNSLGGYGFDIPDVPGVPGRGTRVEIPEMHTGGVVPGRPGQEVLRILEAGELVLSRAQVSSVASPRQPAMAGAGAAAAGMNVNVTTVANANADEVVGAINAKLGWNLTTRRDR